MCKALRAQQQALAGSVAALAMAAALLIQPGAGLGLGFEQANRQIATGSQLDSPGGQEQGRAGQQALSTTHADHRQAPRPSLRISIVSYRLSPHIGCQIARLDVVNVDQGVVKALLNLALELIESRQVGQGEVAS